ncbi:hypothetical protein [Labedaea rhizosphaerae]|uniref:Antibiotic biosynthesis monooxygenase n=1 Tax=Labedaea rhizosphaerae TaxID=598644 RepID=A0A4V3CZM4_LABRH|nr:hypothetical protein [Labedaea rhizosphaerae]TDQ00281.1 hypothetical protein EV186_102142 [Labedaea rhizosphaerae]
MSAKIIQYRTRREAAAENRRLVEAVLREAAQVADIQYAAFQQDDGVTFVHIVSQGSAQLTGLASFAEFQRDFDSRVEPGSRTTTTVDVLGLAVAPTPAAAPGA